MTNKLKIKPNLPYKTREEEEKNSKEQLKTPS